MNIKIHPNPFVFFETLQYLLLKDFTLNNNTIKCVT